MTTERANRPTRLILARHGESSANVERRFAGHADSALTREGRRQAQALGRRLRHELIDAAYASDLSRARETAQIALRGRNIEVRVDRRLRELHFGEWEERTFDEIREGFPDLFSSLLEIGDAFCAPGGEPLGMTRERVLEATREIAERHSGETVLIVAHGGTLQIILADALGMADGRLFRLGVSNCSVSVVEYRGGRPFVTLVNDVAHTVPRKRRTP